MMKKKWLLIIMALYLLITTTSCSDVIKPRPAQAHILSIGLDYSNTSEIQLRGSVDDAVETAFCLREVYEKRGVDTDMRVMLAYTDQASNYDDYPTAEAVEKAVKDIKTAPNDLVVFYFSGHAGIDEDKDGEVYLGLARTKDAMVTRYYIQDLYKELEKKGCACVVILDACYSGNMTGEYYSDKKQTFEEAFRAITTDNGIKNISVMASSAAGQESGNYYMSNEYHGFFTYSLLEFLGWEHSSEVTFTYEDQGYAYDVGGKLKEEPRVMSTKTLYHKLMEEWVVAGQDPTINETTYDILIVPYIGTGEYTPYGSSDDEGVTIVFQVQTSVSGKLDMKIKEEVKDEYIIYELTYVADENSKWPTYFIWTIDGEFLTDASRPDYINYLPTMQTIEYKMDYVGRSTITCLAVVSSGGGGSLYGATSGTSCSATMDTMKEWGYEDE